MGESASAKLSQIAAPRSLESSTSEGRAYVARSHNGAAQSHQLALWSDRGELIVIIHRFLDDLLSRDIAGVCPHGSTVAGAVSLLKLRLDMQRRTEAALGISVAFDRGKDRIRLAFGRRDSRQHGRGGFGDPQTRCDGFRHFKPP
jgi:hypothetical protein